jgi:hypothetical protein
VSVITVGRQQIPRLIFEHLRRDELDSANYFDSQRKTDGSVVAAAGSAPTVPKSPLDLVGPAGRWAGRSRRIACSSLPATRLA